MKRAIILFFIVNILCFGEETLGNKNNVKLIQSKEESEVLKNQITELSNQIIKSNNELANLSRKIQILESNKEENSISNIDQIYEKSIGNYDNALKDIRWLITRISGVISVLLTTLLGVTWLFKRDSDVKLKKERQEIEKFQDKFKQNSNLKFEKINTDIQKFQNDFTKMDDYIKKSEKINKKVNYKFQFTLALTQEKNEIKKIFLEKYVVPLVNEQDNVDKIVLYNTLGDLTEINEEKINYYKQAIKISDELINLSKQNEIAFNYFERGILFKKIKDVYINLNNKEQLEIFLTKAINNFENAIQLEENQNYIFEKVDALIHMAKSTAKNEYYTEAINLIEKIKIFSRKFYLHGKIYYLLATDTKEDSKRQDLLNQALVSLDDAISLFTSKNDDLLYDTYLLKSRINNLLGDLFPSKQDSSEEAKESNKMKKNKYYEEAIENIEKINPNFFSANEYKQKANCELKLLRYDEAVENYSKALEYDPNNLETLNGIALAFYNDKDRDTSRAIRYLRKIIKLDSKCRTAYNNLAEIYINQENFNEGIKLLYECLSSDLKNEFNIEVKNDSYDKFLKFLENEEEQEKNELTSVVLYRLKNLKGFNKKS